MKKLLLPLLVTFTSIALPSTAIANEAWLVLSYGVSGGNPMQGDMNTISLTSMPMKTLEGCKYAGQRWKSSDPKFRKGIREYECLVNR